MAEPEQPGLLLGVTAPAPTQYAPQILHPLPRAEARERLGLSGKLPFTGCDTWHAYELSWLDDSGHPVSRVGRFTFGADAPYMVESKSFKLYLNSLNNCRFSSEEELRNTLLADLEKPTGGNVVLELFAVDDPRLAGQALSGRCLDLLDVPAPDIAIEPAAQVLTTGAGGIVEEQLYTHLLRSLCPVTAQPDWGSLWLHYRGPAIDHSNLLRYILSFRQHREFHEQCVERIFRDIQAACGPELLQVQGFYTRRGGLDINPFRSSSADGRPLPRLNRQ